MKNKQALELLAQAASQYRGTLEEHGALQEAVKTLSKLVEAEESEDTEE